MAFYYIAGLSENFLTNPDATITFSGDTDDSNFPHENIANGKPWEPMRFAAAGTDDYIHAALTSSVTPNFTSVHFHNLSSGITVQLRRGATGSTLVSAITRNEPAFYTAFTPAADDDWRLTFSGTNPEAIYIGEWVLASVNSLTRVQKYGWTISQRMPQNVLASPAGIVLTHNFGAQSVRTLKAQFIGIAETDLTEHVEGMLTNCAWGEEPLIVVPDSDKNIVLHGRPRPSIDAKYDVGGLIKFSLEVTEDPGPIIVK